MSATTKSPGPSLRDLLGCGGEKIDWRFPAVFFVANLLSNLPELVRSLGAWRSMPPGFRAWFLVAQFVAPLVLSAAAVLAFRAVRGVWLSVVACAVGYEVVMTLVRLAFSQRSTALQFALGALWVILFFAGLILGTRLIAFLPLGLAAGATAGSWLHSILFLIGTAVTNPAARFSFSGEATSFALALVSWLIFGFGYWGGLRILGLGAEMPAAAAPGALGAGPASETDEWLRKALAFNGLSRQLRSSGVGSLLFGAVAVVLGILTLGVSPVNGVLAVLGLVLIGEGIWIMTSPSTAGIVVDGLVVAVLGLWNIGISLGNIERSAGSSMAGRFLLFGIFQIAWGIGRMVQSRRYADLRGFGLDAGGRSRLEDEIASIVRSGPERADVVAFDAKALRSGRGLLRLVGGHAALLTKGKVDEVIPRGEIVCEPSPKAAGDPLQATLRLRKRRLAVTISREACERLQRWTGRPPGAVPPPAVG